MAVNKYKPHLYVIPEDDANRQMAVGFEKDYRIRATAIQILRPAGGWKKALDRLSDEYYRVLDANVKSRVLVLIDRGSRCLSHRRGIGFCTRAPKGSRLHLGCNVRTGKSSSKN